jgi:DNA-binding MarR family transcriptional regulator
VKQASKEQEASATADVTDIGLRLSVAISRLRSRLREGAGLAPAGFTLSQLAILQRLLENGPMTAASLATSEHITQQAIAQNVAILKAADYVKAERDATDGRKMLITVTPDGRNMLEASRASRNAWLIRAVESVIAPGELADLDKTIELLERLASARPGLDYDLY